jgi:hypothetical protein
MRDYRKAQIKDLESETEARRNAPAKPSPTDYRVLTSEQYGLPKGTKIQRVFKGGTFVDDVDQTGQPVVLDIATGKSGTPHQSTRVVNEGEYESIPAGTEIRTIWNGETYEDQIRDGKPYIASVSPSEKQGVDWEQRKEWNPKKQQEQEDYAKDLEQQAAAIQTTENRGGLVFPVADAAERKKVLMDRATEARKSARDYRDAADRAATEAPRKIGPRTSATSKSKDGKYHYTTEQIRQQAEANGVSYDELLKIVQADKNVVIDQ